MSDIADIGEVLLLLGLSSSVTETERAIALQALRVATGAVLRHLNYDPVQAIHTEYYPQNDFRQGSREGVWEVEGDQAYLSSTSGASTNELQIKHLPIRSITSLKIDYDGRNGTRAGSFGSETTKTEGTDFWANYDGLDSDGNKICRDGILRSQGLWPDQAGSVKIVYVAGYTQEELHGQDSVIDASPILDAVLDETVRRVLKTNSRMKHRLAGFAGPLTSENLGDYGYSSDAGAVSRLINGGMDLLPETTHKLRDFVRYDLGVL